ncbi:ester cyclase [Amycolatopsis sp. Poz14]|uniref:ester cyclase n=1 Tax=Amycolatopsis sp. Poz14 TaxID=1447705 RepID=UPI001EE80F44|nr:ester cyclase [Amycolatopsis sp. Poz14]MCG3753936.1 ester cyclase [Amycolatopsis sp. Poz14]
MAASPFADDVAAVVPTGPVDGAAGMRGVIEAFVTAFPDMTVDRRNIWVDGDAVIAELGFSATHTGPLTTAAGEVPASGNRVEFPLVDVFVVRDGKVREHRVYWDNAAFLAQLGVSPDPAEG